MGPMESVRILRPMNFGYNKKIKSHSISSNTKWLLGLTGSATILGIKFWQLGPIFTLVTIQYQLTVIGSNWVGSNKYIELNYWVQCEHQPQLLELCTQYSSWFNTHIKLATISIMQVLTYPVYLEIPFFNQMVLDSLCFCIIRTLPLEMFCDLIPVFFLVTSRLSLIDTFLSIIFRLFINFLG